jgi:hypothetical protein
VDHTQLKSALRTALQELNLSDVETFEITVNGVIWPTEGGRRVKLEYERTFFVSQSLLFHTSTPLLWKFIQQQIRSWHTGFVEEGQQPEIDVDIHGIAFAASLGASEEQSRALSNLIYGVDDLGDEDLPKDPVEAFRRVLADSEIAEKNDSLLVTFHGTYTIELTEQTDVYGIGPAFRDLDNAGKFELLLRVPTALLTSGVATTLSNWVHWNIGVHLINMVASSPLYSTPVLSLKDGDAGPVLSSLGWRTLVKLTAAGAHYGSLMPSADFVSALSECIEYLLHEADALEDSEESPEPVQAAGVSYQTDTEGKFTRDTAEPEGALSGTAQKNFRNAGYVCAIEVGKLLCKELGIEWTVTDRSIQDLIADLGERSRSGSY